MHFKKTAALLRTPIILNTINSLIWGLLPSKKEEEGDVYQSLKPDLNKHIQEIEASPLLFRPENQSGRSWYLCLPPF